MNRSFDYLAKLIKLIKCLYTRDSDNDLPKLEFHKVTQLPTNLLKFYLLNIDLAILY